MRSSLLAVALLVLVGCGSSEPTTKEVIHKNIDRVFMHSGRKASFFSQKEDGSIDHTFLEPTMHGTLKYFADVPRGEKMWAKETIVRGNMSTTYYVDIHLHSVDEVDGGEWNHGKHGSGTVSVVE